MAAQPNPELNNWTFESQRDEIAPTHWPDEQVLYDGKATLGLSGDGKFYVNGCWTKTVPVEAGKWYKFETFFNAEGVTELYRSVLARVIWLDADGKRVTQPEYPRTLDDTAGEGWRSIQRDYLVPESATQAKMELVFRWDAAGKVNFSPAVLSPTDQPAARKVRLATIFCKPRSRTPMGNLELFGPLIDKAAADGADIVCLPEGPELYGNPGTTHIDVAAAIPGPQTELISKFAARNKIYVVAGLFEKDGSVMYNVAVLFGRDGQIVGKYRKVCKPREGIEAGVTPGDSYPTFETDFGRVGMMVCWDNYFPEAARTLMLNGAEIIFLPIWGGSETLTKARAIENQVYVVTSSYATATAIFSTDGEILAQATEENTVAIAEVDLSAPKYHDWLGDIAGRLRREMPPRSATIPDELK